MDTILKAISSLLVATAIGVTANTSQRPDDDSGDTRMLVSQWQTDQATGWKDSDPDESPQGNAKEPLEESRGDDEKSMQSYRPKKEGWKESTLTESDVRRIAREVAADEYAVQKQVDFAQARRYATQSNGSSGGRVTQQRQPSWSSKAIVVPVVTSPPTYYESPVVANAVVTPAVTPIVTTINSQTFQSSKVAVKTRSYRASSGCTIKETTFSDGSVSRVVVSCPVPRSRAIKRVLGQ